MGPTELKKMRWMQVVVTDILFLIFIFIYFICISLLKITLPWLYIFIGVFVLIQGIRLSLRIDSTKSLIPLFQRVAIYEKQKMGDEWRKQRKIAVRSQFLLSGLMFLLAFLSKDSTFVMAFPNLTFIIGIILILLVATNIGLLIQFGKVDKAQSPSDLKGYSKKSTIIGIVVGGCLGFVMCSLCLLYVLTTN